MPGTCAICGRPANRALCWAHLARKRRGTNLEAPLRAYRMTLMARAAEFAIAYADAETDEDLERAKARARMILRDASRRGTTKIVHAGPETDPHGQHSGAQSCEAQATGSGNRS